MSKPAKILTIVGASIGGLIIAVIIAAFIVIHTHWFANYVRGKIASTLEQATGAKVEIGSIQVEWSSITIHIRNIVVHGTEPAAAAPLLRVAEITAHLKLFSGIAHLINIAYVGVQQPQVDLISFPDGRTNLPHPKVQKTTTKNGNSLQTVVDLKIGKFDVENGLIQFSEEKTAFHASGENLRLLLNYNGQTPSYLGGLSINPLVLASAGRQPLLARINIPLTIEANAVRIRNAAIRTGQSAILLNASLEDLNAPKIQAGLNATISLPEMTRSFQMPIYPNAPGAPKVLTAELAASINEQTKAIQVQKAHIALGDTNFQAAGALNGPNNGALRFSGDLALAQLTHLLNTSTHATGNILISGGTKLDAQDNYVVDGTVNSRDLALSNGTTHLSNVSLYTPFHADPHLIALNQLQLRAMGGELTAKLFIENMRRLTLESRLRSFDLPVIAAVATGKRVGYDGVINGSLKAQGDLKAAGTSGFTAQADLAIVPGHRGVPLSGRLLANYIGATDEVTIGRSYVALPHSRLDVSGGLNQMQSARISLSLISHNLNDFLPAMNFGSSKPETSLPITLRRGGAAAIQAQITGKLAEPHIAAHAALTRFDVEQHPLDELAMNLAAAPSGVAIENGMLNARTLNGNFNAEIGLVKWKPMPRSPVAVNLILRDPNITDLMAMSGAGLQATGALSTDVHIHGTYGDPLGNAVLALDNASFDQQPIDRLYVKVNLAHDLITLAPLQVTMGQAELKASGSFRHPDDSFTTGSAQFQVNASNLQLANLEGVRRENRGVAGLIQLKAAAAANISRSKQVTVSNVALDLSATGLQVDKQSAGDLTANARTINGTVQYSITSNFAGSKIDVNGRTALAKNYFTTASASIQNLSVGKALAIAGESSIPASGTLSANAHVSGTMQAPTAQLAFALTHAEVDQQRINSLNGSVQYSNTLVNIPSIALNAPAGTLTVSGAFSHPANNFKAGSVKLNVNTTPIQLQRIELLQAQKQGVGGTVRLAANLAATFQERNGARSVRISDLDADASGSQLRMDNHNLGDARFTARTSGRRLTFALNSDIAQSNIHGSGEATLTDDYRVRATLSFANIRYTNLYPFISTGPAEQPKFDALVAGQISVNGPALKKEDLQGQLRLTTLQVSTLPQPSPTGAPARPAATFQNDGPLIISVNHELIRVQQFHITGPETDITAAGAVDLRNASSPLRLRVNANANLAMLQDINRDFYSSGSVVLQATIHGTPSAPAVTGDIQLKSANIEYAGSPAGISNANAVILLRGTTAEIQSFTGETGGGKVDLSGFASYTGRAAVFNLRAAAHRVRILYSGVTVIASANITLTGNNRHSLLGGRVVLDRIAYGSSTDAGSLLNSASAPPSSPAAPSPMLAGMRLDIHILSSPGLRIVSSYVQTLQLIADLTVRGTAANPGMVGSVRITNGTLLFFGNKYTVNIGTVDFYNPYEIQPVLNFSLQTIVQGVSVTLGVSGPMDNLRLSYTSDPPLTFEQIVELLATNTTPSTDPTIAANQPPSQPQSFSQMGESAILSQAVANPVASRLQKIFGISEFKIDPSFQGSNGLPTARITLKQQIMSNLTFTYIEDLSQTNAEIIRIEWDFTPQFSAVATRDWNGVVGLEFLYAFTKR